MKLRGHLHLDKCYVKKKYRGGVSLFATWNGTHIHICDVIIVLCTFFLKKKKENPT